VFEDSFLEDVEVGGFVVVVDVDFVGFGVDCDHFGIGVL